MTLNEAIQIMTGEIVSILADNKPTIYLFGSVVLDDFKLGWSDIDIIVLTEHEITEQQAETLVGLRQTLLECYPGNPYFRLFEGGILSADAFLHNKNERTVYWGTSGQRITNGYKMDSFGMAELLDSGKLLYGDDIREKMTYPTYAQMRDDIARHVRSAREYGTALGWLLDIARGIYTLRTGKVIAKTAAGEWALENGICPDADAMHKAVRVRKDPTMYSKAEKSVDNAVVQRFADVLENELSKQKPLFINDELSVRRMHDNSVDRSLILNWLTDPNGVTTVAWKEGIPWDTQKIEKAFFVDIADEKLIPCIIEQDGRAIGYIQFYPLDVESYRFNEWVTFDPVSGGYGVDLFIAYSELWGKGIGTRIVKAMSDYLIHTLGATVVCADPGEENRRSIACWLKAGFMPIGKVADYDGSDNQCTLMVYSDNQRFMDKWRTMKT